jgi:hypothetical protein
VRLHKEIGGCDPELDGRSGVELTNEVVVRRLEIDTTGDGSTECCSVRRGFRGQLVGAGGEIELVEEDVECTGELRRLVIRQEMEIRIGVNTY